MPHVLQGGGGVAFPGHLQGVFFNWPTLPPLNCQSTGSHAKLPVISLSIKDFKEFCNDSIYGAPVKKHALYSFLL